STSRINCAPTISSAHVSDATTQPWDKRPNTNGRTPCGSRAAYKVLPLVKVKQKAPWIRGKSSLAEAKTDLSSPTPCASNAVMIMESDRDFSLSRYSYCATASSRSSG